MARRQIARGVADAIGREPDAERAERLSEAFAERMERLDVEAATLDRPVQEIIGEICRDLGLDAARMIVRPPIKDGAGAAGRARSPHPTLSRRERAYSGFAAGLPGESGRGWDSGPERPAPDG